MSPCPDCGSELKWAVLTDHDSKQHRVLICPACDKNPLDLGFWSKYRANWVGGVLYSEKR